MRQTELFMSYLKLVSFCVLLETRVYITTRFVSRPTSTQQDKIGHYEVIFNSFPAREFMLLMQFLAQRVWQTGYAGNNCSFPSTWHVLCMQKRSQVEQAGGGCKTRRRGRRVMSLGQERGYWTKKKGVNN